ncbi:MAG TPA: copper homeostasis protein CutC [Erysipelothrix sp.]
MHKQKKPVIVEVCATSLNDCLVAEKVGAHRIELNQALHLGGLTPSYGLVKQVQAYCGLPIIVMIRARGAGFCYSETEFAVMYEDAKALLELGVAGLAFGFLTDECTIDKARTQKFVSLCHAYGKQAVFHRAFDRTRDPFAAIETLIDLRVDRILTSGLAPSAYQGMALLKTLQKRYSKHIELCVAAGINETNVAEIVQTTQINQVHGSFKSWQHDPTTESNHISQALDAAGHYEYADAKKIKACLSVLQ